MVYFDTTDRSRRAEDEYFRRQDAEILHRARALSAPERSHIAVIQGDLERPL